MANPPSRKRTWKDAAAASKSRPVEEPWRKDQGPARRERPWWRSRRAKLGFVFAALLVVITIIIDQVVKWRPVKPMHLVLLGPGYETNLFVPHNVPGRNGVKELKRLHEQNKWGNPKGEDALERDFGAIETALKDPQSHTSSRFWNTRKTVVVFVSAHGVARFENDELVPYLVPEDHDLNPKAKLYPLNEILELLAQLPPDTPKLLLLDVTQVNAHWPLGELHNDFPRALRGRAPRIKEIPNLVVISSSNVDQRSWVAPEWGQTYFAHFILEGLKGAADGIVNGKKDGRVDALELFRYVRSEVNDWVWHNRARIQEPVMFDDNKSPEKMELVNCGDYEANNSLSEEEKYEKIYGELENAWKTCQKVRKGWPHPAVFAPHLWRRYLDMLLRAEQLLRAGDASAAEKLLEKWGDLQRHIENSRSPELKSAQLTLTLPAALGMTLTEDEQKKLKSSVTSWEKNEAKKDEVFKDWEKKPQFLRAALAGEVMRKVATGPKLPLNTVRRSLEKLDAAATECRAAEVHYLMMLCPEVGGNKSSLIDSLLRDPQRWPLVQQSLQVRLLAEQAALGLREEKDGERLPAYSEQVLPWIRELVENADGARRLGQDLLFASATAAWDEAKERLDTAQRGYKDAQERAFKVRRALEVRDRIHAELHYYTHWVAEDGSEHEELAKELWRNLHELDHQLDEQAAKLDQLDILHDSITKDFEELTSQFRDSVHKEKGTHQARWHQIEAALAVPFLEAEERLKLIQDSRKTLNTLFKERPTEGDARTAGGEREDKKARRLALRQGRLALSVLGDDWPKSRDIRQELDNAKEETWRNSLTRAGEHVGELLNLLPERTDELCGKAAESDDLKTADKELRSAARNARIVEGAAVDTRMNKNPIEEKRRLDWHHLLSWQAERTYLDWWAELKPGKEHYYQRAAKVFLDDAESLVKRQSANPNDARPDPRLMRVEKQREKLRTSPDVVVKVALSADPSDRAFQEGPARVNLTDEPDGQLRYYRLFGPDAKEVPGAPVMWVVVDTQPKARSVLQVSDEDKERKTVHFGSPNSYLSKIAVDRGKEPPENPTSYHVVHGFFRGHHSELKSEVKTYSKPDVTLNMPLRSGGGSVAVQTKKSLYELFGAENMALSIVFDCSGSMNYPDGKNPRNPSNRFHKATRALKSVLEELPEGVTVSLRAFGALEFDKTGQFEEQDHFDLVWPPDPWKPERLQEMINKVDRLTPWFATPLLRSIRVASQDFPRRPFVARTVIVVTDGGDSEFNDKDKDKDLKKESGANTITKYLKYLKDDFDEKGIQLIVIGFDVKEQEIQANELKAYRELKKAMNDLGLVYKDAENVESLTETLRNSLLRSYYRVDPKFGELRPGKIKPHSPITPSLEAPDYIKLPPDDYKVSVPAIRNLKQSIKIGPGEVVLLDLEKTPGPREAALRQSMYAESENLKKNHGAGHIKRIDQPLDGWLLAVLQNYQSRVDNKLQILATLQKDQGIAPRLDIQQVRPEWLWFEVPQARAGSNTPHLYITAVSKYPAPAWELDLPRWERKAPVKLKSWWLRSLPSQPHGKRVKGQDFPDPFAVVNQNWPINVPPGSVWLESLTIEKQAIKVQEDREDAEMECLVVRLRYPPDQEPFFVRWPGWQDGEEHRFYTEAGKYTGLFWSASGKAIKELVRTKLEWLDLYSVSALKKDGNVLHGILDLGEPNEKWVRPDPAPVDKYTLPD